MFKSNWHKMDILVESTHKKTDEGQRLNPHSNEDRGFVQPNFIPN